MIRERPPGRSPLSCFGLQGLVARRLGIEPATAGRLVAAARARLGRRSFWFRAACFTVGLALPARAVPRRLRRRALLGFVGPLLQTPAALNAYGAGRGQLLAEPCGGIWPGPLQVPA